MKFKARNLVGKEIYIEDSTWKVEQVIRPNKFDCYLLCSANVENQVHSDGKTMPTLMTVVDVNNDEFVRKNTKTERLHDKLDHYRESVKELEDEIGDIWMDSFEES